MATTPLRHRIFAGLGAVLFLVTASAFTIMVVIDMARGNDKVTQDTQQSRKEEILPTPEVYKPTDDVTELQTTDLTPGSGEAAKVGDSLIMKYYGTLATDGTVFDQNFSTETAFTFKLGAGEVIQGWDKGLEGMKVGGMRRLVVPSDQAYGESGRGSIPANADLVFVVKLLRIQK